MKQTTSASKSDGQRPATNQKTPTFFHQLPYYVDYLDTIKSQDDYESPTDLTVRGLSDEQVSQIAIDSLRQAKRSNPQIQIDSKSPSDSEN